MSYVLFVLLVYVSITYPYLFLSWKVRLGDLDLSTDYEGEEQIAQERKITKIAKHPKVSMKVLNVASWRG
jgi:hypothetical protein